MSAGSVIDLPLTDRTVAAITVGGAIGAIVGNGSGELTVGIALGLIAGVVTSLLLRASALAFAIVATTLLVGLIVTLRSGLVMQAAILLVVVIWVVFTRTRPQPAKGAPTVTADVSPDVESPASDDHLGR